MTPGTGEFRVDETGHVVNVLDTLHECVFCCTVGDDLTYDESLDEYVCFHCADKRGLRGGLTCTE